MQVAFKPFISLAVFMAMACSVFGQTPQKKLVQFSGVVLAADTLEPLPFVSVFDKTIHRATFADYSGFFSFVVQPGDTIMFSSIGYRKTLYIIPDTLTQTRYTMVQLLQPDTIVLRPVDIYPWPTREEFAQAFLDLELPQTAYDRYKRNMTLAELKAANNDFGDALSCYDAQISSEYSRLYSQGQVPTLNLLSPAAWKSFIKTWKSGGFKNKKKKNN